MGTGKPRCASIREFWVVFGSEAADLRA
jgi:hypothetical protein